MELDRPFDSDIGRFDHERVEILVVKPAGTGEQSTSLSKVEKDTVIDVEAILRISRWSNAATLR